MEVDAHSQPHTAMQPELLRCVEQGGAVVTANARAARSLHRGYAERQQAAARGAWEAPLIHDWESWLTTLWQQYLLNTLDAPLLLSPLQERSIWKRIVGPQAGGSESIAILAMSAWKLLGDFAVHEQRQRSWRGQATTDAEAFRDWGQLFERECGRKQWITRADLPALLTEAIQRNEIRLPAELFFLGFDRFAPAQLALIDAARAAGSTATINETPAATHPPFLVASDDQRDELAICGWWARRQLEANPDASIAIIVQDLGAARGEIDRTFRRILMPQSAGIEDDQPMPFEFSLGQPLSAVPVIKAALLLLRWVIEPLKQAEISWLMLSGFLNPASEDTLRLAILDAEIRKYGEMPPEAPLETFAAYRSRSSEGSASEGFLANLRILNRTAMAEGVEQRLNTIPAWLQFAEKILKQAHWPGTRALASIEFQALDRWQRILRDFSALGFEGIRVPYSEFASMIERYAGETIFSPESHNAPIQIMGAFESSGQRFDAVWFLGADDRHWPASAQPHPLLPLSLQRRAGMPHATIETDWQLASTMTRRIASSSPQCVFSYARHDELGEVNPSPLLKETIGEATAETICSEPRFSSSEQLGKQLKIPVSGAHRNETVIVEEASSIPWPKELPAGGADILKRQSACPFQAFATRRLGAEPLDVAERGLTPIDRGNILHNVLEELWSGSEESQPLLQTRDDLRNAQASGSLAATLDHHIEAVFNQRKTSRKESAWTREYLGLEKKRLRSLLLQWLTYEAEREPFTVVAHETRIETSINGLKLNLRVDRIDQVDGGHLILDYKTSKVSPALWSTPRPDEPQLPLYATYGGIDDLRGVLFAQIRAGELCLNGHAENATATVTTTLTAQSGLVRNPLNEDILGDWADALGNLADQFLLGEASVTPKSYPKTCQYCPLPGLCRVAETAVRSEAEDEDDTDVEAKPPTQPGVPAGAQAGVFDE